MKHQKEWHTCDSVVWKSSTTIALLQILRWKSNHTALVSAELFIREKRKEKAIVLNYALIVGEILRGL